MPTAAARATARDVIIGVVAVALLLAVMGFHIRFRYWFTDPRAARNPSRVEGR